MAHRALVSLHPRVLHARSFCLLTFALPSLAALALPQAVHAASAVHGRRVRAAADCAAALRISHPIRP